MNTLVCHPTFSFFELTNTKMFVSIIFTWGFFLSHIFFATQKMSTILSKVDKSVNRFCMVSYQKIHTLQGNEFTIIFVLI